MAGAALLAVNVHCLARELGLEGPLHITGLQINRVFKQMVLRRAPYISRGSRGRGGSFSSVQRAPPSSTGGVSEAGQASRDAPTPKSLASHTDPLPGCWGQGALSLRPQCTLCTARELGGGGHTGPLVLSQGHATAWNNWKCYEACRVVTGIRGAWHLMGKQRLLTVLSAWPLPQRRQHPAPG